MKNPIKSRRTRDQKLIYCNDVNDQSINQYSEGGSVETPREEILFWTMRNNQKDASWLTNNKLVFNFVCVVTLLKIYEYASLRIPNAFFKTSLIIPDLLSVYTN